MNDVIYHEESFLDPLDYHYDGFDYDTDLEELLMNSNDDLHSYFNQIFTFCMLPVIQQAFKSLLPVLSSSIFIKFISIKTNVTPKQLNLLNIVTSVALFMYLYEVKLLIFLAIIVLFTYCILATSYDRSQKRFSVIAVALIHLSIGKVIMFKEGEWNSIKGKILTLRKCRVIKGPIHF